jgi:hypothetical protein
MAATWVPKAGALFHVTADSVHVSPTRSRQPGHGLVGGDGGRGLTNPPASAHTRNAQKRVRPMRAQAIFKNPYLRYERSSPASARKALGIRGPDVGTPMPCAARQPG